MGSLEKVTTGEALVEVGRGRPQAARHRRAGRVRARAEDRRARRQPHLRGGSVRPRRDARRRDPGRGRDAEPAHDQGDPAAHARRRLARRARGARRGVPPDLRVPGAERAARRDEPEARAEPAQRRRRLAAPEELGDHGRPAAVDLGLRRGPSRGGRVHVAVRDARVAARARLPHEPLRRAAGVDRGRRRGVRRVGEAADRARLRDRRDRDQGRLARPAAPPRRAALAAALGARVQVGADDGRDEAAEDPRSESAARARSTRGR